MFTSVEMVKTLKYRLKITESIRGKCIISQSKVKLQRSPRKLYIDLKGPEVLWVEGWNNGKALVNPGAFPFVNINIDPYNSLMRDGQHHTIHDMGYDYLIDILKFGVSQADDRFDKIFLYSGIEKHNERMCYKILINNNNFGYKDYKVLKSENLTTIAKKLMVNDYMILINNNKIKNYNDIEEGDVIKVPSAYAKSVELFLDKDLYVPVGISISDEKGLYEDYQYFDLEINPVITDEEFTKHFKGYHF